MLTGLLPISAGEVFINGYHIRDQTKHALQSVGICPQQDVIWSDLTVYEHLYLHAGLKGKPYSQIKREVDDILIELRLTEYRESPAGSLSGGLKRKLCLAMAFIGKSKVLLLDEPTYHSVIFGGCMLSLIM